MTLAEAARRFLGVPFLHQGRDPVVGLDCIGLLAAAAREAGLTRYLVHDRQDYGRDPHGGLLEARLRACFGEPVAGSPVDLALLHEGDVLAMRFAGPVRHVGIVGVRDYEGPQLTVIHTDNGVGRVTEHRIDDKWRRRIALVFRPETDA